MPFADSILLYSLGTSWPNGPFDCFLQMMMVSQSCSLSQPPTIFSYFSMTIAFTTVSLGSRFTYQIVKCTFGSAIRCK
ncbi:hypothetical protein DAI22_05g284500 [Oryza sativa Japonica Group]|nr:hypothetical protein DAI22_05g284500 [Oryza sativa Japonica Group]